MDLPLYNSFLNLCMKVYLKIFLNIKNLSMYDDNGENVFQSIVFVFNLLQMVISYNLNCTLFYLGYVKRQLKKTF